MKRKRPQLLHHRRSDGEKGSITLRLPLRRRMLKAPVVEVPDVISKIGSANPQSIDCDEMLDRGPRHRTDDELLARG